MRTIAQHTIALLVASLTLSFAAETPALRTGIMPKDHAGPDPIFAQAAGIDWMRPYDRTPATTMKRTATGFFRVEKIDGKWWFIDPKGFALWGAGINGGGAEAVYTSDMWGNNPTTEQYLVTRQQTVSAVAGPGIAAWVDYCRGILDGAGMQIMASGAMDQVAGPLPTCRLIDVSEWFYNWNPNGTPPEKFADQDEWHDIVNMWHPDWPAHCEALAAKLCAPVKNSPWIVGWFLNNERSWPNELPMAQLAWKLPANHPAKQALVAQARKTFSDVAAFNTAFATDYADWDGFAADSTPRMASTEAGSEFLIAFGAASIDRFYAVASAAVRRADPNHLLLGGRDWVMLHNRLIPAHLAALGKYCDVISYNSYFFSSPTKGIAAEDIRQWRAISAQAGDKPILMSEWGINAAETKCVMQCYQMVQTRQQRADLYAKAVQAMAAEPTIIGNLWFCFDEGFEGNPDDLSGTENRGWLRRDLKPYPELQAAAAKANREAQKIRATKLSTGQVQPGVNGSIANTRWLPELPAVTQADSPQRAFTCGDLSLRFRTMGFCDVFLGDGEIGSIQMNLSQFRTDDSYPWPERIEKIDVREGKQFTVIDLSTAAATWRGGWRIWLPKVPTSEAWFATQNLWIENCGKDAWQLTNIFHQLVNNLGGHQEGDDVPGSYLERRSELRWADQQAGLGLSSWGPLVRTAAWKYVTCVFDQPLLKTGGLPHTLLPGQRYDNPASPIAIHHPYRFEPGSKPPSDVWSALQPQLDTCFGPALKTTTVPQTTVPKTTAPK